MDSERVRGATKSATHSQLAYQVAGTQQLPPVGSSSKDRRWARRAGPTGASRFRPTPSDAADGRRKKVEGSPLMLQEQHAALPPFGKQATAPSISRIPLGPRAPNAIDSVQQQQVTASRIPRPPQAAAARLESPGLAAVLDTPNAPGGLSEMQPQQLQAPGSTPPVLPVAAFHTYNNPSFDGATEFLVASPDENNPAAAAGAAAPDIRQQPPSSRTVTTSVDGVAHNTAAVATAAPSPPGPLDASSRQREGTAGQVTATTPGGGLPTPEAWQLLQHLNQDSPAPESDSARGVQGIMNAFLRTGPQMLSPEPAATGAPGAIIPAPGAAAVPAQGLMAVAGRGGTGVYGMMHAYLRTGPDMLSPEPGAEEWVGIPAPGAQAVRGAAGRPSGQQQPVLTVQAAQHGGLAQLYSPIASPLADTPARVPDISGQPVMPSSIGSNAESSSSAGAPAASISLGRPPVPRLPLERLCSVDNGEAGVEAGAEQLPEPTLALSVGADSEAGEELPTARLLPAWGQAAQCAAPAAAPRLPSPISFVLPGDSPAVPSPVAAPAADADRDSPSFSFGLGATAAPLSGAPDAEQEAQQQSEAAQADAPGEGALAGEGNGPISAGFPLQRIRSGETVQGPNPFQAMLRHLNHSGPGAYASPAPAPTAPRCDSPQSPLHLTPLHLISAGTSDASPPLPLAPSATPELGVGSLTAWAQRRGMAGTLGSRAMADLRTLWGAVTAHRAAETEADAAREEAAVLAAEVEVLRGQLADLGVEHEAALAAANAGALCAKSEVARAQEAARQMMALAEQIQATFAACEEEKAALLAELQAAQEHLAASEASAASAEVSEARAAELAAQLEAARTAVSAAEAAAADAQARAEGASAELDAVRAQLEEAAAEAENARQAEQQQAQDQAAEEPSPAPAPAPPLLDSLRSQLGAVASTLRAMLAKQAGWQGQDGSPAVQSLLSRSRRQLELVEALVLGGTGSSEPGPLAANTALRAQVAAMRSVLAAHGSPAAATSAGSILLPAAAGPAAALFGSPVPFSLAAEGSGERGTPGTVSDAFSSPYLPSRTTITVDFRDFSQSLADTGAASPASSWASASPSQGADAGGEGEDAGAPCTVVAGGGGMVITNVPASEVNRVKSMVAYWEGLSGLALATGDADAATVPEMSANEVTAQQQPAAAAVDAAATPVPTGADAEAVKAADPEAFADAAVEAARLMGVAQKQAAAGVKAALPALPPSAARPSCSPISAVSFAELLPSGEAAGTPLRTTPMHFAAVLPPAPACTPESAPSSALDGLSALRTVPEITPVSLEALRRRAGAGEAQDEVRGRLARLKADLQAAQAKLHTVDRGLAAIAHTPASAATSAASGTPSSGVVGSRQQQWEQRRADSPALGSASFASRMRDGGLSSSPAPAIRAVVEATAPTMAAVIENQPAIMGAAAAAAQQSTPLAPATKRLVRFAADTLLGSSSRQPLRNSTPAMLPMTAAGDLAKVQPSPVVATVAGSQRTPVAAGSATRLTPAVARSVNKPSALRNFDLGSSESEGSSSDDDDDASRMARGTVRGTPHLSAAAVASSLTPRLARGSAPPPTPGTAGLSTTSFSPPEPLALLAIRPLGRPRRAPLLGGRGRRPSESEEREFRRRAAALCIQVSPLFGRSRKGSNGDGA